MRRHLWLIAAVAIAVPHSASAQSWLFRQAAYSHDPDTGLRVAQYMPERQPFYRYDDTYQESGYRHYRSALRGPDGSYDFQHIVQTWGQGELIRPYGEWQFPYRAGATPYGPWGNPSGPWTLPFDSWVNPYGLGQLPWGGCPTVAPRGAKPRGPTGGAWQGGAGGAWQGGAGGAWRGPTSPIHSGPASPPAGPGPWAPGEMP